MTRPIIFRGREYPADWPEIRRRILARAGHKCEWCGAKNHEPHPKTRSHVVLTIAHIYDKWPEAAEDWNLAALCQRCHLTHDAQQHQQRAKGVHPSRVHQTSLERGS